METLKLLGQIAGIGGISLGLLLMVFRDIIGKKIFPNLTKQQGYKLLELITVLTFIVALLGVSAWIFLQLNNGNRVSTIEEKTKSKLNDFFTIVENNKSKKEIIDYFKANNDYLLMLVGYHNPNSILQVLNDFKIDGYSCDFAIVKTEPILSNSADEITIVTFLNPYDTLNSESLNTAIRNHEALRRDNSHRLRAELNKREDYRSNVLPNRVGIGESVIVVGRRNNMRKKELEWLQENNCKKFISIITYDSFEEELRYNYSRK
jgi:hypothetical protein